MKKQILLTLVATMIVGGSLVAAETAKVESKTKPEAKVEAKAEAKEAPAAVTKNDAPGSLKGGNALLNEGKFEEAAAYFEGIGEQSSTKREPYRLVGLSTAQLELGKYEETIATTTKVLKYHKDLAPAWNNLAAAYARSGQRDKAVSTYKDAIAAVKAEGGDTAKLEKNQGDIEAAIEAGKPRKVREAEAKAKEATEKAVTKVDEVKKAVGEKAVEIKTATEKK